MSDINIGLLAENQNLSEFEITENFSCVRFLDQNKERFELEFNLEKGTSFNTFFIRSHEELFIIHPPEKQYLNSFNLDSVQQYPFSSLPIKDASAFRLGVQHPAASGTVPAA